MNAIQKKFSSVENWVDGSGNHQETSTPPTTADVVGEYARARQSADTKRRSAARQGRVPGRGSSLRPPQERF